VNNRFAKRRNRGPSREVNKSALIQHHCIAKRPDWGAFSCLGFRLPLIGRAVLEGCEFSLAHRLYRPLYTKTPR
jgi:uncharacterized protein (DUF2126 family)